MRLNRLTRAGYLADGEDLSRSGQVPSFTFGGFGGNNKSPTTKATKTTPSKTEVAAKERPSPAAKSKEVVASIAIDKTSQTSVTSKGVTRVNTTTTAALSTKQINNDNDDVPDIVLDDGPDDSEAEDISD